MYELRMRADDVARVRFAPSPIWEVAQAVRTLVDPRQQPYHLPWLDDVRNAIYEVDVAPLVAVQPLRGYNPDLIAPSPPNARTTFEEQLAIVRATPLALVREELSRVVQQPTNDAIEQELRALVRHPRKARQLLVDTLEMCWHRLVEPYWPRILDLLTADISYHSRVLAEGGLSRLFPTVSSKLAWRGSTLHVDTGLQPAQHRKSRGEGLLLQPSVFVWPNLLAVWDERYQPTVVYPARGVAELWQPAVTQAAPALSGLLGDTRATLLLSVREPATTTMLARRHRVAPATVSEHLAALAAARLVRKARNGRSVMYATTPLGEALLNGDIHPP